MGGKAAAKALMEQAGVPLVPGYHGEDQDAATVCAREADAHRLPGADQGQSPAAAARACAAVDAPEDFAAALAGAGARPRPPSATTAC